MSWIVVWRTLFIIILLPQWLQTEMYISDTKYGASLANTLNTQV